MFDSTVYKKRREALIKAIHNKNIKDGLILFPGAKASPINYPDNCYMFRQDSNFLYYFGIQDENIAATIDIATASSRLYVDMLTLDELIWFGNRPNADEYLESSGANFIAPRDEFANAIAIASGSVLYTPPYQAAIKIELATALGIPIDKISANASIELIQAIVSQREIKEPREIAEIEKAVNITTDMHLSVMALAKAGMSEAELMAIAYQKAYANGGMPSFQAIATTQGSVLHNHNYNNSLESGGLFLFDAGAETSLGYAGDLTSTFPINKTYDSRQKDIYNIVLKAGTEASAMIKPGITYKDAHLRACKVICSGLIDLGIMRGNVDEAVANGAHACFFPHGLGHQIGLDVHDMESFGEDFVGYDKERRSNQFGLRGLRMAKKLLEGMVISVEPGIYFIDRLITMWEGEKKHEPFINYAEAKKWIGFGGIRNEEDWCITSTGGRKLGKPFDKSIAAMEKYKA